MDGNSTWGLMALIGMLLCRGVLSIAYSTLINADKKLLHSPGAESRKFASTALTIRDDSRRLMLSVQIASALLQFGMAAITAIYVALPLNGLLARYLPSQEIALPVSLVLTLVPMSLLTILFGKVIPESLGAAYSAALIRPATHLIKPTLWLMRPLYMLVNGPAELLMPQGVGERIGLITEDEIMTMVDAGEEGGIIERDEKEMIFSIFRFGDTLVREIMVPRIDIVALEVNTPLLQALDTIIEEGHSRIPVYHGSIDHIEGLLYAKDLLTLWRSRETKPLVELLRPAYFVPETKRAASLLAELQERRVHMAIVVDEYGGTAGLVTIEDLVEEIVGEIRDEYDLKEEEFIKTVGDGEFIVDARISLEDLSQVTGTDVSSDDADTLGGLIFSELGRVPSAGDTIRCNGLEIEVLDVLGRRIRHARVYRLKETPNDNGEAGAAA